MTLRRILQVLAVLAVVALSTISFDATADRPEVNALTIGAEIPMADAKLKGVDDAAVAIAELQGDKGTLVMFTCNHCPFVVKWEDRMAELGNAYMAKGVRVIAINSNDPGKVPGDNMDGMKERAKKLNAQYPYVMDEGSKLAQAFGASRTPEAFLFDASGKLVYHGTVDDNAEDPSAVKKHYLRDALEAVVNGTPVEVAETKAPGCSIKWYE